MEKISMTGGFSMVSEIFLNTLYISVKKLGEQ